MIHLSHPARLAPPKAESSLSLHSPGSQSGHTEEVLGPARPGKDKLKYLVFAEGSRAQILARWPFARPHARSHTTEGHELPTIS